MQYPQLLTPTNIEKIILPSGRILQIPKANPQFTLWNGKPVSDTYGKKMVLNFDGKPAFAELVILKIFQEDGWCGVWVDTYGKNYRTEYWPKNEIELPALLQQLLFGIYEKSGSDKGCFDVFCWKGAQCIFAESKRHGHDKLRDTQRQWVEAAILCGLPITSFLVVEWSVRPMK